MDEQEVVLGRGHAYGRLGLGESDNPARDEGDEEPRLADRVERR